MFDYWKARRNINKRITEVEQRLHRRVDVVSAEMVGYVASQDAFEANSLRASLKLLETERLITLANEYDVEVPPMDDIHWTLDQSILKQYLTEKGKRLVVRRIRDKRFAFFSRWGPIIAILISLLSLVISLWKR